jgi:hypothetical protein
MQYSLQQRSSGGTQAVRILLPWPHLFHSRDRPNTAANSRGNRLSVLANAQLVTRFHTVGDWIKLAKQRQLDDYLSSTKRTTVDVRRSEQLREAEKDWIDRVQKRVDEIREEGFFIHMMKKDTVVRIVNRGEAEIELIRPSCFEITYKNILQPTTLLLRNPILVHHHRVVQVRELNSHNIEEVLKFVALGMKEYLKISTQSRLEHNLQGMIQTVKKDEHEQNG